MAVFTVSASAQSIIGKWATEPQTEDEGKIVYVFNFKDKNSIEFGAECDMSDEDVILNLEIIIKGIYKRDGNQLSVAFKKQDAQFNIKKLDYVGEDAALFEDNPDLKNVMIKMVKDMIESQKDTLLEDLPSEDCTMTILELTNTTLKLVDKEDESVTDLHRVK